VGRGSHDKKWPGWHNDRVVQRSVTPGSIEQLVEHMFDQVFTEDERAELLVWIHRWEAANPDVDAAHRVTGWIDVAYAFQARLEGTSSTTIEARVERHHTDQQLLSFAY
jgi:hypothetical protein